MCKRRFCLDLLSGGYSHTKQYFQHTVCCKMFTCKIESILNLRQNLIFTENLRFQSSGKIKKMLYSFFIFTCDKIFFVRSILYPLQTAQTLIHGNFLFFFVTGPYFKAVAGRQNDTAINSCRLFKSFHCFSRIFLCKRKQSPNIYGCSVVINSYHGYCHDLVFLLCLTIPFPERDPPYSGGSFRKTYYFNDSMFEKSCQWNLHEFSCVL